jgi:segregation and condensation protein B
MEKRVSVAAVKLVQDVPERPDEREAMRVAEAVLFASAAPLSAEELAARLPEGADIEAILQNLVVLYADRGVNLVRVAGKWTFRTASDLAYILSRDVVEQKKLSRAAMETLAIIAYHQPVTRAEIEDIRGVATSKGTLDLLLETGWVRLRGRRRVPGRPVTYGTTPAFLEHFGLDAIGDLPGLEELKGAGFIEGRISQGLSIPTPSDAEALAEDEDPLDGDEMFRLPDLEMHEDEGDDKDNRPEEE